MDGGIHWESGKPPGVLCINNNQNQILPSSLFTTPPTKMDPKKTIKVKFLNDKQDVRSDDKPLLRCGQCGQKPASLVKYSPAVLSISRVKRLMMLNLYSSIFNALMNG